MMKRDVTGKSRVVQRKRRQRRQRIAQAFWLHVPETESLRSDFTPAEATSFCSGNLKVAQRF